jgi:nucleoside-diphosphate-sugar epimerase
MLEGWWLFGDDRQHVVAHQTFWEQKMLAAGYGQVEWTEGQRPEAGLQRIIIALASKPGYASLPDPPPIVPGTDLMARQAAIDDYVSTYSEGLDRPVVATGETNHLDTCVLVTGATGSLGAHLVAHFASIPDVKTVVCLNRRSSGRTAQIRQRQEMESKGIGMTDADWSKLQVFEADTSKPLFGLTDNQYAELVKVVTHIVHSAWPMSINKPVKGFEPQFRAMRNLIQLALEAAGMRNEKSRISFQFISSIATVGLYPLWSGRTLVPEKRMTVNSILASGYSDAKFICERMLDETLHNNQRNFRMVVRIGQIAGSKTNGYWNRMEHLAFLLKSSQTLNALPQFDGVS